MCFVQFLSFGFQIWGIFYNCLLIFPYSFPHLSYNPPSLCQSQLQHGCTLAGRPLHIALCIRTSVALLSTYKLPRSFIEGGGPPPFQAVGEGGRGVRRGRTESQAGGGGGGEGGGQGMLLQ